MLKIIIAGSGGGGSGEKNFDSKRLTYLNVAAGMTDVPLWIGNQPYFVAPKAGSLVAVVLQSSADRTAGTLTVEPTINGVKIVPANLDAILDVSQINDDVCTVSPDTVGFIFAANDKLGLLMTTSVDWTPVPVDVDVDLYYAMNLS